MKTASQMTAKEGLQDSLDFRQVDANGPLPYPDSHFDAAISIDAMNHIVRRPHVLREGAGY